MAALAARGCVQSREGREQQRCLATGTQLWAKEIQGVNTELGASRAHVEFLSWKQIPIACNWLLLNSGEGFLPSLQQLYQQASGFEPEILRMQPGEGTG